ncbi:hypothetical protein [Microbulbifer sp. VAAF005]|uniref:hypothetical protein n=1 Tax=Microbulbifer sp. VAAF005 TaxID=3034230 RepID=UPI0024AD6EDD|nr:hypothetical protein [Microbulbifer sp. VAAF005]WHI46579.1 hypothetical protein P0078_23210 [Microbulbifer sp. VAAF005]
MKTVLIWGCLLEAVTDYICEQEGCESKKVQGYSECALHCSKSSYSIDFKSSLLNNFYQCLFDYIVDFIYRSVESTSNENSFEISKKDIRKHLEGNHQRSLGFVIGELFVIFDKVQFPSRDDRDLFDYQKLLSRLDAIHFHRCSFSGSTLSLDKVKVFYQDCIFSNKWDMSPAELLPNVNGVIYQDCIFEGNVYFWGESKRATWSESYFCDCKFERELAFENVSLSAPIFKNSYEEELSVGRLSFKGCEIHARFDLCSAKIGCVFIVDTKFLDKFKLMNCFVERFSLSRADFDKIFDVYATKFGVFSFSKAECNGFVNFEDSEFGIGCVNSDCGIAKFEYATFTSFANFRGAAFNLGLDLERVNLDESPNFLNVSIESAGTNRETFRVIKDSFDGIGNHIEANKYYVLEMKKYREELSQEPPSQEKFIFHLNSLISDFGNSYIRPIGWIVATSIVFSLLVMGYEANVIYKCWIFKPYVWISGPLNTVASNFLPFKRFLKEGMEFVSLIFYILNAGLVWQTIVALKRHSRR